jgi:hypothetical protein
MVSELMSKAEPSDNELKAEIMYRLLRKGCWGKVYLPVDALVKWLGNMIKRNGKRVRKLINVLVQDGYAGRYKKGEKPFI